MSSPEQRVLAYLKERAEFYSLHYMASVGVIYAEAASVIEGLRSDVESLERDLRIAESVRDAMKAERDALRAILDDLIGTENAQAALLETLAAGDGE